MDTLSHHADSPAEFLENHPFKAIRLGDGASLIRQATQRDIQLFAAVSGDVNPAHVDALYAKTSHFHEIIAHGMLGGSLISSSMYQERYAVCDQVRPLSFDVVLNSLPERVRPNDISFSPPRKRRLG